MAQGPQFLRQAATVLVADVDRGRRPLALDEEPALRVEVALGGAVEVEVILTEVGEGESGERTPASRPARNRARSPRAHSCGCRRRASPERPVGGRWPRGRANRRPPRVADSALDRAEEAGPPACRAEDRVEEKRRGRLAVRPGDGCDLELRRWIVEEGDRRLRHRASGVGTTSWTMSSSSGRSTTSATAPRCTASRANVCPSCRSPGTQKKSAPGWTARVS
jgi:hypothetical protein